MNFFQNSNLNFISKAAILGLFMAFGGQIMAQVVSESHIITTNDLRVVHNIVKKAKPGTALFSDIDEVGLLAKSKALQLPHRNLFLPQAYKKMAEKMGSSEDWDKTWCRGLDPYSAVIWRDCKVESPDKDTWKKIVETMREKDLMLVGLTAGFAGDIEFENIIKVEKFHEIRIEKLKQVGITVDWGAAKFGTTVFENLEPVAKGYYPMLYGWVLFCCNVSKPVVFDEFCKRNSVELTHMIFIDDSKKNVEAMEKHCAAKNINFTGVHYTKVEEDNKKDKESEKPQYDPERAAFQFKHLVDHQIWLEDEEADRLRLTETSS